MIIQAILEWADIEQSVGVCVMYCEFTSLIQLPRALLSPHPQH